MFLLLIKLFKIRIIVDLRLNSERGKRKGKIKNLKHSFSFESVINFNYISHNGVLYPKSSDNFLSHWFFEKLKS